MAEKEVYGRCMDDCLFPVMTKAQTQAGLDSKAPSDHNHDDRYYTQEVVGEFIEGASVYPVKITETVSGTSATYACDTTLGQIHANRGTPQVHFYSKIGENEYLRCIAPLYHMAEGGASYTFASAPDQNGISHFFSIGSGVVLHDEFSAMKHFQPVPVINEATDDNVPNVFAVRTYSQQKPLILGGTISATDETVTLDGTVTASEVETAIEQGRDVKLHLTFTDEGMTAVSVSVPLVAVKGTILNFATLVDVSPIAAANYCSLSIPIGRADLTAYAANFRRLAFQN